MIEIRRGNTLIACLGVVVVACGDGDEVPTAAPGGGGDVSAGAGAELAGEPAANGGRGDGSTQGGAATVVPDAGASGDLVTAGAGGEGGAREPSQCPAGAWGFCDDANPCTVDTCDAQRGCLHAAMADGAACDDANVCTHSDVCENAVCHGRPRASDARVLGSAKTFGAFLAGGDAYQGLSAVLSDTRLLFAEPLAGGVAIRLVGVFDGELRLLSEAHSEAPITTNMAGLIGDETVQTQLVPLTDTRFALFAAGFRLELFDVVGDELVASGSVPLYSDPRLDGVVGLGDLLYACNSELETYDVSPGAEPKRVASVNIPYFCTDVALSPDHAKLYVSTTRDLRILSLQDPRKPALLDEIVRSGHYYSNVAVGEGHLALLEDVFLQVTGDAVLLDAAGTAEQRLFPSVDGQSIPYSIGFVGGGLQLLSQRFSGQRRELVAESYGLGAGGPQKRAELTLRAYAAVENDQLQGFEAVTRAGSALSIAAPTRQVLRFTSDTIEELRGVEQGNLSRVVAADSGHVAAYGSTSTHLIDISEPQHPRIVGGGLAAAETGAIWLQLSPSGGAPELLNVPIWNEPVPIAQGTATVAQFSRGAGDAPKLAGTFRIGSGLAQRAVSAGLLFELSLESTNPTLRTLELPRTAAQGHLVEPFETQQLELEPTRARAFGVDEAARALVIAHVDEAQPTHIDVDWLEHDAGSWHLAATLSLPSVAAGSTTVASVLVRKNWAAIISSGRRVDVVERTPAGLVARAFRDFEAEMAVAPFVDRTVRGALGMEGGVLYVHTAVREDWWLRARVLALRMSDLVTMAEYDLPQHPTSMATMDGHLVFGMPSHVTVASPACAADAP